MGEIALQATVNADDISKLWKTTARQFPLSLRPSENASGISYEDTTTTKKEKGNES